MGWAYILVQNDVIVAYGSGGAAVGTNNIAELTACIEGLKASQFFAAQEIELVSDSQYALGIANGEFSPNKNLDLANDLRELYNATKAVTRWVRGHSGVLGNEIVDKMAKKAKLQFCALKETKKEKRLNRKQRLKALKAAL